MSDSANMNGHIRPTVPAAATDGDWPDNDQFVATSSLLRLLVGGVLLGADELRDRLQRWEEDTHSAALMAPPPTVSESLRYAIVGMLFETETRMRRRFFRMLARFAQLSDEADIFYTNLAPILRGTPLDPLRMRLDELYFLVMATVDRWMDRGWIEEQQGRRMARQATGDVIDELLDYMARNPEVRKLIEQQGLDMAESAVDEVRGRSEAADRWIERLAHSLLHRPVSDKPAKLAGNVETPLPAAAAPTAKVQAPALAAQAEMPAAGDPGE